MNDPQTPPGLKAVFIEPLREEEKLLPDPAMVVVDPPAISLDSLPHRAWVYLLQALPVHPGEGRALHAVLAMKSRGAPFDFEVTEALVTAMLDRCYREGKVSKVQTADGPRYARIEAVKLGEGEDLPKSWTEQLRAIVAESADTGLLPADMEMQLRLLAQTPLPRTTIAREVIARFPKLPPEHPGAFLWSRALAAAEDEQRAATSPENIRAQLLLMGISADRVTPDVLKVAVDWGHGGLPVDEILRKLERISEADMARELWRIDNSKRAEALPEAAPDTARPEQLVLEREPGAPESGAKDPPAAPMTFESFEGHIGFAGLTIVGEAEPTKDGWKINGRIREEDVQQMHHLFGLGEQALLLGKTHVSVEVIQSSTTLDPKIRGWRDLYMLTVYKGSFLKISEDKPDEAAPSKENGPHRLQGAGLYALFSSLAHVHGVPLGQLPPMGQLPEEIGKAWDSMAVELNGAFADALGRELARGREAARLILPSEAEKAATKKLVEEMLTYPGQTEEGTLLQVDARGSVTISAEVFLANVKGLPDLSGHVGLVPELLTGEQLFLAYQECATEAGDGGLSLAWEETAEQPTWNALARRYSERLFQAEIGRQGALDELARERKVFADFGEDMSFTDALDLLRQVSMLNSGISLKATMLGAVKAIRHLRGQVAGQGKTIAEQEGEIKQLTGELTGWRDVAEVETPEAFAEKQAESRVGRSALARKVAEQGRTIADLDAEVKRLREEQKASPYQGENAYLLTINDLTGTGQIVQLRQRVIDTDLCAEALHRALGQGSPLGFAGIADVAVAKIESLRCEHERARLEIRGLLKRLSTLRSFLVAVCAGSFRTLEAVSAAAGKAFSEDVAHNSRESGARAERHAAQRLEEAIKGCTLDPAGTSRDGEGNNHVELAVEIKCSPIEALLLLLGGTLSEQARVKTERHPGHVHLASREAKVIPPWWMPRIGVRPSTR